MRKFKLVLSFMIFIGLLGGVGYGIYDAITNQPSEVSLSIDGEMKKITDVISDFDRIAEGVTIQLPDSDEDLLAFGISKVGYTFDCWTYDARGNQIIENSVITKKQGKQTLYLKWKKKNFEVYKIELKDEYAENFNFNNYNNLTYYKQVANTVDELAPNIVQFEDYLDLTTYSPEPGYEYTWLKWIGEGECEKDEKGVPIYYSVKHQIKENLTFVRCKMPKKYTITYKFIDEKNKIQTIDQKELLFKKEGNTIVRPADVDYSRIGYEVSGFYITAPNNNAQTKTIEANKLIDEDILNFAGTEVQAFDCFVTYTPKLYDLTIKGYANNELIYDQTEISINKTYQVPYYTNVLQYLNNILENTSDLAKNYLIFQNKFTLTDNQTILDPNLTMPAEALEINAHYEIREYNIFFALKLKDQLLILNDKDENQNYINPIRYGMAFDLNTHHYSFDEAVEDNAKIDVTLNNVIISTYYANEFDFTHYTVRTSLDDLEGDSNLIQDNIKTDQELASVAELTRVERELYVILNTVKVRFFVEFVNKGVSASTINNQAKWTRCARKEIAFVDKVAYFKVPKQDDPSQYEMIETINHQVPTPSATGKNSEDAFYTFGGWKCENEDAFGEYAYLDYGYKIEEDVMEKHGDDIRVYAEWYETDLSGALRWEYKVISEEDKTIAITRYTGSKVNLAIPSSIMQYTVVRIGDGKLENGNYSGNAVISQLGALKKILIPTTVTSIAPYAFSASVSDVLVRFAEDTVNVDKNLTIETFSFSPKVTSTARGISSIYLPKRTAIIQEGAFAYNTNIKNIVISEQNKDFSVVKTLDSTEENYSVVLMKNHMLGDLLDKREIITYCHGAKAVDYEIPANVSRVCNYAFTQNENLAKTLTLRKITIAENNNLKEIGKEGFAYLRIMDSIYLPNLPRLELLGEGVFQRSFSDHEEIKSNADLRFNVLTFDFNDLTEIPNSMFKDTRYLHGINLINAKKIVHIGDTSFNYCGFQYTSSGQYSTYANETFIGFRKGFVTYLFDNFGINLTSSGPHDADVLDLNKVATISSEIIRSRLKEYLQSFLVWSSNPLNKVGQSAFMSSVFSIYTNSENFVATYNNEEPNLALSSLANIKIYSFNSFEHRFVNDNLIDSNVKKITVRDAFIGVNAFNQTNIHNLGIHLIDCFFAGSNEDHTGSSYTFTGFTINDLQNVGTFDFVVELTQNASKEKQTIQPDTFNSMSINNSTFKFISNVAIDKVQGIGASLGARSLMSIKCKGMELTGLLSVSSTTFAPAQENNSGTINRESAQQISFYDCHFVMTQGENFRNLMFYELYRLKQIDFINCPSINEEYSLNVDRYNEIRTCQFTESNKVKVTADSSSVRIEFGDNLM